MKLVSIYKYSLLLVLLVFGSVSLNAQQWSLEQCIDTAQVHNKNLQMSRNNMLILEQKEKEAKANLLPKLALNADYRYYTDQPTQLLPQSVFGGPAGQFKETRFGVPHNINANIQLSMPLYNAQLSSAVDNSKIASELTELQYQRTAEQVIYDISNLYYNAQILHHQLSFIDSNLVNTKKLQKNISLLHEQLMAKSSDVSKVDLQIEQLNTQKEVVRSRYVQVLNTLKFLMGLPQESSVSIDPTIKYQVKQEYASLSTIDIRQARIQNRLISAELNTIKYSRLPTLSLFGSQGTTGLGYDKSPDQFLKFFPVGFAGIQLSYPLFQGTVTKHKINQKKYELKNNELQISLLSEQNLMQVDNAKMQRQVARKSTETILLQMRLAQSIYNQNIIQQKEGTASLTDVLLADNALREAQQSYLNAIVEYLKADLEYKKLTGNISVIK
ncbi:MAG: transporter [Sphingobacteriales bacterium 17-39-43]|uniref:TolC family protein n=1 Tax=Daejeonella sp. TaxID=2805397 RepID=UPI000BC98C50|nr:TolC family protein [Daejeonella sp.]OYZ29843.1 MAG: transporter [Sphingobacteriales bacterium 16-39-50]OZA22684.1 MAG: transporter [Sphingobacteriales bacterium 17-39-43]HQT24338.1 TolC family protein [Daejeonella sp.]HQT59131.1 TolC family protein [Daejeonella sp.]